ncbi:P-loop containing nucleoside triphosphate hydrolase protein [Panus rudis PR-1116 ss-1]|nr:P-loop containing nucleoside triphosphate hydrolase protein [Panus rudis PR-1116 ss-1]
MDLDDFELTVQDEEELVVEQLQQAKDVRTALRYFDRVWYSLASRRGRIMDLIGDYGGSELFIIDGDSLVQTVLDDSLLALGRDDEPSFQILHALHSLERLLNEFHRRSAVFDVIFWDDNRHHSLLTGESAYKFASRSLARSILIQHLKNLDVTVHVFENTQDPEWNSYLRINRPMFAMVNDGGNFDELTKPMAIERALFQRILMHDLISQGVSVSLLQGAEFRDSKINSLLIEQRLDVNARKHLHPKFWQITAAALATLTSKEQDSRGTFQTPPLKQYQQPQEPSSAETVVAKFLKELLAHKPQNLSYPLLYAFAAHLLLLPYLSAEERARKLPKLQSDVIGMFQTFLSPALLALGVVQSGEAPIDVDGRIFLELAVFLAHNPTMSIKDAIGENVATQLTTLWQQHKLPEVKFSGLPALKSISTSNARPTDEARLESFSVLPFHNEFFDELLSDIHVEVSEQDDQTSPSSSLEFSRAFVDSSHWHNHRRAVLPRHLGGEDPKPQDAWQRKKQLRRSQQFMAQLERQANTLMGAFGRALQRTTIVSSATPSAPPSRPGSRPSSRAGDRRQNESGKAGGKGKKESAAERIRREHAEKKQAEEDASNRAWWSRELEEMSHMSTAQKVAHLDVLMRNSKRASGNNWLSIEMRLYDLNLDFTRWLEHPEAESAKVRDQFTVTIMRKVKAISEAGGLFLAALKILASVLVALGFEDLLETLVDNSPNAREDDKHKLHFEFVKLVKSKTGSPVYKWMRITEDSVVWQLRLFGEYMDRSMDSQPDSRVPFYPDAWQRKVLDCLDDDGHSVLVVAPTSAGKTFISYYAMEKVLKNNDDDVLVYVAPTKALVAQIAAEVLGRFTKSYKTSRHCWAIHTRDYRIHDPINCQILITVPEVLASLLLSPPLAKVWTPRIKRIILDEIHSIGQQEGGAVWEQIILLAPCPIIGLSATVGNPDQFNNWLASVQEAHGFKHSFIHHPHRYSHLRKFTYVIPPTDNKAKPFHGLDTYRDTERTRFLHPVSLLSFGVRDLPPDFALEARDCLTLYQAYTSLPKDIAGDLDALNPSKWFERNRLLKQKDIIQYETELKNVLKHIIESSNPQDSSSPLMQVAKALQDPMLGKLTPLEQNIIPSKETFLDNLLNLIADLHVKGDLPALLFNFDRNSCENMAKHLIEKLTLAEEEWRKGPEWKEKLKQWERWQQKAKERQRQAEKAAKAEKNRKPEDTIPESAGGSWEETFNPDDPSPQFSFASVKGSYTRVDLEEDIQRISWAKIPKWAIDALRRGIAVHHAGMNRQYRTLVESLFRLGFVRVVIATGTLALGINAPAKTTVFCGDSPFLTALQFRQCAGRAGRRGYDLLGKVVFYGLAIDRAQRLVLSKLPSLGGNFPITSTMVLRLFNLLQGSNYAPVAKRAVGSLLTLPHVSFISDTGRQQLLHHVRFSIDYLRRAGLLDASGNPIDLFGIAAHLYYTEPSNLALVALLRSGIIHRICSQGSVINAKRDFLLIMAHLFNRQKLPKTYVSSEVELIRKSPSMVILPPLPDDAKSVLAHHDKDILRVFSGYALAYAEQYREDLGPERQLPLSRKSYPALPRTDSSASFVNALRSSSIKVKARCLFVANSGHGDNFQDGSELSRTTREGLHLNDHAIPTMDRFISSNDTSYILNAYLLDFYIHGQLRPLSDANAIRPGDVWYLLQDFNLALKAVRSSIEQLLLGASSGDVDEGDEDFAESVTAVDPAEIDEDDDVTRVEGEAGPGGAGGELRRPTGVTDSDWKVFKVVDEVTREFDEKFKAIAA